MERGCLTAVGAGIALVSAHFVAAAIVESATGGDGKTSLGVYAGLIVFFGGTFAGGAYLVWKMLTKRPAAVVPHPGDGLRHPRRVAGEEIIILRSAEEAHDPQLDDEVIDDFLCLCLVELASRHVPLEVDIEERRGAAE